MRIISGKLKGRRLNTPADQRIRPTTDKVKEAVFSMIQDWIDEDSICIDNDKSLRIMLRTFFDIYHLPGSVNHFIV